MQSGYSIAPQPGYSLREVLPLRREAIGVFCSTSRVVQRILVGSEESGPSAEMQSEYSTVPANWSTGHSLRGLIPLQIYNRCILQSQPTGPQGTRWGVLSRCRYTIGVFYSPSQLVHRALVEGSYPAADIQSVYSTAPANWSTGHSLRGLIPLQIYNRCILQSQPTGPQGTRWGVLSRCRDTIGVFYSPSRLVHRSLVREGGLNPL